MKIYELGHCGRRSGMLAGGREGLFTTVELAKEYAEKKVEEYRGYVAEDPEGTEGIVESPRWEDVQQYLGRDKRLKVGKPVPTLVYGELGSAFGIQEVTVHEVPADGKGFVSLLEELTEQAEAEASALEFLLVEEDGEWVTKCPCCSNTGTIREVDRDIRWNELRDIERNDDDGSFTCAASTDSGGGWENDGYICESCSTGLCAPDGFEITEWY